MPAVRRPSTAASGSRHSRGRSHSPARRAHNFPEKQHRSGSLKGERQPGSRGKKRRSVSHSKYSSGAEPQTAEGPTPASSSGGARLAPPPPLQQPPLDEPTSHLDAFSPDAAASAAAATFSSIPKLNDEAEAFLHSVGLGGSSVYDLRAMEQEVSTTLANTSDDDLGVDEVEDDLLLQQQGGLHPGGPAISGTSFRDSRAGSFARAGPARAGSFARAGSSQGRRFMGQQLR